MSSSSPPIISFELGVGEFRIVTPEAVYQIKVCHDLVEATRIDGANPADSKAAADNEFSPSADFFQELSEEIFEKVGQLARRLSVSVEELPGQIAQANLDETDQQLESAKGQLEEIVKLTEKASMSIMDSADQIQVEMDDLKKQLQILQNLDLLNAGGESGSKSAEDLDGDNSAVETQFFEKLTELKNFINNFVNENTDVIPTETALPEKISIEAEPEPAPPQTVTVTRFDVDVVFQTLYELCTNESVKDHIKRMREEQNTTFNNTEVADKLAEMAHTVDEEDGFFNFPIPTVLKTLYAATQSEDFRTILKKMNQTAASIFLDSVLPIEGETVEMEVPGMVSAAVAAPEPAPTPVAAAVTEENSGPAFPADHLKTIQSLAGELETLGQAAFAQGNQSAAASGTGASESENGGLYTAILTRDRDAIVGAVAAAQQLIEQTGNHLTRILETLSFQDLSGQRIMKVVALIGDIQMQLISILVSVNTKMKVHQKGKEVSAKSDSAVKMAQEEVDKALEKMSSGGSALLGPGAEARLDQGAVNDLLTQMGF